MCSGCSAGYVDCSSKYLKLVAYHIAKGASGCTPYKNNCMLGKVVHNSTPSHGLKTVRISALVFFPSLLSGYFQSWSAKKEVENTTIERRGVAATIKALMWPSSCAPRRMLVVWRQNIIRWDRHAHPEDCGRKEVALTGRRACTCEYAQKDNRL